jgi:hypothetical protein
VSDHNRGNVLLLFPGALGDFVCFLAALCGLREKCGGRIAVAACDAWLGLLDSGFEPRSIEHRAVSELFRHGPPGERAFFEGFDEVHSWTGFGNRDLTTRLRTCTRARRVAVHPFRAFLPGEHACDYYARCLGVQARPPQVAVNPSERRGVREWLSRLNPDGAPLLAVHPGSGSRGKNWTGFADVARGWSGRGGVVVEIVGPAETDAERLPESVAIGNATLSRVAAVLEAASCYIGNDSGVSHVAGAVGARGLVLFGPSASAAWRPRSPHLRVLQGQQACDTCPNDRFCVHRLPVDAVLAALGTPNQRWQPGQ